MSHCPGYYREDGTYPGPGLRGLYESMIQWQQENNRRLSSISIQNDGGAFCAIALAGPAEVMVTSADGNRRAIVSENGRLFVYASDYS